MYSAQLLTLSLPAAEATLATVSIDAAVNPATLYLNALPVFMIPPRNVVLNSLLNLVVV
jgi:hypothetical protein